MSKKITKSVVHYGILLFWFCFALAQGSVVCEFNGIWSSTPKQWEDGEFELLLGGEAEAGYLLMMEIIARTAVVDSDTLNSQTRKVAKYVAALIKFYDKNKVVIQNKHKNIADVLDFIKSKLKDGNAPEVIEEKNHEL